MVVTHVLAGLLASVVGVQEAAPQALPALVRSAEGELHWPDANLVSRLLTAGDIDGDGRDDLWSARHVMRDCGFQTPFSGVDRIVAGPTTVVATDSVHGSTVIDVSRATPARAGRLLRVHFEAWNGTPWAEVRSLDGREIHWSLAESPIPLDASHGTARFLPAADGKAAPEVVVGAPSARRPDDGPVFGAVAKLAGADGSMAWVHWAHAADGVYGAHIEAAGDVDGDGVTDVAVCVARFTPSHPDPARIRPHLELLSGADGSSIGLRPLEPANVQRFEAVGDLDGDRRVDFVVQTTEPAGGEGPPTWLVLSGGAELLRVMPGMEVLWFTPWRDEADAPALLVAARERGATSSGTPGANSLWLVSSRGTSRIAEYPAGISWRIEHVAAGDFDGDGLADLALVQRGPRARVGYTHALAFVAGSSLR